MKPLKPGGMVLLSLSFIRHLPGMAPTLFRRPKVLIQGRLFRRMNAISWMKSTMSMVNIQPGVFAI